MVMYYIIVYGLVRLLHYNVVWRKQE